MQTSQLRHPDDALVATFRMMALKNEARSSAEGRPIFEDIEIVEIRVPGSRNWTPYPAAAHSHWENNPFSGEQTSRTYIERFPRQYAQFKAQLQQTKTGTPLDHAPFLSEGKRAELRGQNIYTVEQLALIDGQELKNLGGGGREMKNLAMEFIAESKATAPSKQLIAELEGLRARNAVLEEDAKIKAEHQAMAAVVAPDDYDEMTVEQLREYITTHTGIAPTGALGHKSLNRLAMDIKPNKAA